MGSFPVLKKAFANRLVSGLTDVNALAGVSAPECVNADDRLGYAVDPQV